LTATPISARPWSGASPRSTTSARAGFLQRAAITQATAWRLAASVALLALLAQWVGESWQGILAQGLFRSIGVDWGWYYAQSRALWLAPPGAMYRLDVLDAYLQPLAAYTAEPALALPPGGVPYPPLFAWLFTPFTLVSPPVGFVLWTALNLLGAAFLCWRITQPFAWRDKPCVALVLLTSLPFVFTLLAGQVAIVLACVVAEFYVNLRRGHEYRAGLWLSLLILKPQYALLLAPLLVWKRQWTTVAAALTGLAVVFGLSALVAGLQNTLAYPWSILQEEPGFRNPLNDPANTMINWRAIVLNVSPHISNARGLFFTGLLSVFTALGVAAAWRGLWNPGGKRFPGQMSIALLGAVLAAPHSHTHGGVLLAAPFAALLRYGRLGRLARVGIIAAAVLPAAVILWDGVVGRLGLSGLAIAYWPLSLYAVPAGFGLLLADLVLGDVRAGLRLRGWSRLTSRGLIAAAAVGFLVWSVGFVYRASFVAIDGKRYFYLFDDALVSMRYAWNARHGLGLTWNPGEHVEGYTNLIMTLVMSLVALVFDQRLSLLAIQLIGIATMLGVAVCSLGVADELSADLTGTPRACVRVLSFLSALAYYPLTFWALTGMETGLLALLLSGALWLTFRFQRTGGRQNVWVAALLLGAACAARPDGALPALVVLAYQAFLAVRASGRARDGRAVAIGLWAAAPGVAACALVICAITAFRLTYYGAITPNTFAVRFASVPLRFRLTNGLQFVRPFLVSTGWLGAAVGACRLFRPDGRKLLILALFTALVGYQVFAGGDPWPYWRMIAPGVPLLLAAFVDDLARLSAAVLERSRVRLARSGWVQHASGACTASVAIGALALSTRAFWPQMVFAEVPYQAWAFAANVNQAIALRHVTHAEATVGVFWAGALPYFSNRPAIDFLGKTDPRIAVLKPDLSGAVAGDGMRSLPAHNKYDLTYSIVERAPTFVQFFRWGRQDLSAWAADHYVARLYKNQCLFLLKDSPAVDWSQLEASLDAGHGSWCRIGG